MSYCDVAEAFDNPLRKQLEQFENENNINNYKQYIQGEHNYKDNNPSYFDAQGDLKAETSIESLKNDTFDDDSSFDISSDSFSTDLKSYASSSSDISNNIMHDYSHEYYIRNYINYMFYSDDHKLSKKDINNINDHVRKCKFCKDETLLRMNGKNKTTSKVDKIINLSNIKYDIKEIVIIVLIGIIIIFILDMFFKLRK